MSKPRTFHSYADLNWRDGKLEQKPKHDRHVVIFIFYYTVVTYELSSHQPVFVEQIWLNTLQI